MESVTEKELVDLEKQIEEKKKEPEPQPEPSVEAAKEPEVTPPGPEPEKAPESSEPNKNDAELYKKKGWKTPEDAIRSYSELEKEFHKKNEELSRMKERQPYEQPVYTPPVNPYAPPVYQQPPQPAYMPPPVYTPPPSYGYQPPSLSTPPMGSQAEAEIAASYQMTVEDFRKLFPMINDMTEVKNRKVQGEFSRWRDELTRETEKNADKTNVLGDPSFYNSDVQNEMHEFFSKNPQVFNERKPYSIALNQALVNIGRKNTTRGPQASPTSLPTEPPKTAGSANGFQGRKGSMPAEDFRKMSLEDQEKALKGMKAFKTYEDLA